ncbi:MAG: sulfite exporter TauE/SafE family protein [Candidatus Tectomicrobia bacterium]|nr:sulfite exporter TauE/SafE family protein [Candidatus Tectomicrobia bacterium]
MELSLHNILTFALASFLTGFFKTSLGGGIGMVVTPLLTLLVSARLAMGIISPLMVLGDFLVVYFFWGKWDGRFILAMLPSMAVGTVLGTMLIAYLSNAGIRYLIGSFVLLYSAHHLIRLVGKRDFEYVPPKRSVGYLVGLLAGFSTSAAHAGGIITSPYLVSSGLRKEAVLATGFGLYALTNWLKLGTYLWVGLVNGQIILWDVYTAPLLALGAYLGYQVHKAISTRAFNSAILVIAILSALKLLLF